MSAGLNGSMNVVRDGQAWRVGRPAEVSWIADGTKNGQGIAAAIPPIFATYATLWDSNEDRVTTRTHEHAVVGHLIEHTAADQTWWLGFLDTGAHDIVFTDAPRVTLYSGWSYVLIEAGPTQAVMWRTGHMRSSEGALPDLMFPADRAGEACRPSQSRQDDHKLDCGRGICDGLYETPRHRVCAVADLDLLDESGALRRV